MHGKSILVAIIALLAADGARADDPPPYPEFTFRRVAVAPKANGPRIKVQIDPAADPFKRFPSAAPDWKPDLYPGMPGRARDSLPGNPVVPYGAEFWAHVSPRLEHASAARLSQAVAALGARKGPAPEAILTITRRYGRDIARHTMGTRISPALVAAIISVESAGREGAISHAGAQGLMQLMPATAARFGVADWKVPSENIRGGVAYLDWLANEFQMDPVFILAGYNAGEGAVHKHGGVPPYDETRDYVQKVLSAWRVASALCRTPPREISDRCDFIDGL